MPGDPPEFWEFAQTRTVSGVHVIASPEALRDLIEARGAWGWTVEAFQERCGVRLEGDTAYVTTFVYAGPEALADVWVQVQAGHAG